MNLKKFFLTKVAKVKYEICLEPSVSTDIRLRCPLCMRRVDFATSLVGPKPFNELSCLHHHVDCHKCNLTMRSAPFLQHNNEIEASEKESLVARWKRLKSDMPLGATSPCPLCEGKSLFLTDPIKNCATVKCTQCGLSLDSDSFDPEGDKEDKEEAMISVIEKWNSL